MIRLIVRISEGVKEQITFLGRRRSLSCPVGQRKPSSITLCVASNRPSAFRPLEPDAFSFSKNEVMVAISIVDSSIEISFCISKPCHLRREIVCLSSYLGTFLPGYLNGCIGVTRLLFWSSSPTHVLSLLFIACYLLHPRDVRQLITTVPLTHPLDIWAVCLHACIGLTRILFSSCSPTLLLSLLFIHRYFMHPRPVLQIITTVPLTHPVVTRMSIKSPLSHSLDSHVRVPISADHFSVVV